MVKRPLHILAVSLALILLASTIVIAAGSSTKTDKELSQENGIIEKPKDTATSCDNFNTRRDRIQCRLLLNQFNNENTIDESCVNIRNQVACQAIYKESYKCYDLPGRAKDACLKRAAGFEKITLAEQSKAGEDKQQIRNYLVLVLYDLQEKVEDAQENQEITTEDAAILIDKIIEIKQEVLKFRTKGELKPKMKTLKDLWGTIMK
jgi:hypothetical protein